jgi:hypothetical protein
MPETAPYTSYDLFTDRICGFDRAARVEEKNVAGWRNSFQSRLPSGQRESAYDIPSRPNERPPLDSSERLSEPA